MIPWFPGGHCDPWNHVETAMALDVAGFRAEAFAAYRWLMDAQLPDGAWHNYYMDDGRVEEAKLDTNVVAYIATGGWHHWLCTRSRADAEALWPTVERAIEVGARAPARRRARVVGRRGRRHPHVGLRAADRLVEHRPRPDLR